MCQMLPATAWICERIGYIAPVLKLMEYYTEGSSVKRVRYLGIFGLNIIAW